MTCPVTDCTVTPPPNFFMCVRHLEMVPFELRVELWRATKNIDGPEQLEGARAAAIDAVNRQGARA